MNNSGIFDPQPFEAITDAAWLRFFETNVMSGVRLSRAYLPAMRGARLGPDRLHLLRIGPADPRRDDPLRGYQNRPDRARTRLSRERRRHGHHREQRPAGPDALRRGGGVRRLAGSRTRQERGGDGARVLCDGSSERRLSGASRASKRLRTWWSSSVRPRLQRRRAPRCASTAASFGRFPSFLAHASAHARSTHPAWKRTFVTFRAALSQWIRGKYPGVDYTSRKLMTLRRVALCVFACGALLAPLASARGNDAGSAAFAAVPTRSRRAVRTRHGRHRGRRSRDGRDVWRQRFRQLAGRLDDQDPRDGRGLPADVDRLDRLEHARASDGEPTATGAGATWPTPRPALRARSHSCCAS